MLTQIKPFNELHRSHQSDINIWKNQHKYYKRALKIDCDQILRDCLVTLGVPQLEPYLAWIPPLMNSIHLSSLPKADLQKFYRASIYLYESGSVYKAAAKEIKISMVTEVRLLY